MLIIVSFSSPGLISPLCSFYSISISISSSSCLLVFGEHCRMVAVKSLAYLVANITPSPSNISSLIPAKILYLSSLRHSSLNFRSLLRGSSFSLSTGIQALSFISEAGHSGSFGFSTYLGRSWEKRQKLPNRQKPLRKKKWHRAGFGATLEGNERVLIRAESLSRNLCAITNSKLILFDTFSFSSYTSYVPCKV